MQTYAVLSELFVDYIVTQALRCAAAWAVLLSPFGAFSRIQNQKRHHLKMTYDQEFLLILQEHNVNYDRRFVLG